MTTTRPVAGILAVLVILGTLARVSAHEHSRFVGTVVKVVHVPAPVAWATAWDVLTLQFKAVPKQAEYETIAMAIRGATVITRDDKKVTLADLKPGVTVVADASGDTISDLEASEIQIVPAIAK